MKGILQEIHERGTPSGQKYWSLSIDKKEYLLFNEQAAKELEEGMDVEYRAREFVDFELMELDRESAGGKIQVQCEFRELGTYSRITDIKSHNGRLAGPIVVPNREVIL